MCCSVRCPQRSLCAAASIAALRTAHATAPARGLVATHVGTLDVEFPNLRDSRHNRPRLFRLSPRRKGRGLSGFGAYDPLRWTNPHPGEGEATVTRAGSF